MGYVGALVKVTRFLFGMTDGSQASNDNNNPEIELVADLIETTTRRWKKELIENIFPEHTAQKILQIPVAKEVWRGEHTGEFTVRSAYKLLQEATLNPNDLLLQTETKKNL
ncbi:reverse transcriptase [Gossypium australe]|uniref:Reverse transcriptase n=1 Tax=Gossypium australe TaxID=47621 RepID=A0A5B6VNV9_9ROSI|nr:reverse transcriptase [Gossypium australe]